MYNPNIPPAKQHRIGAKAVAWDMALLKTLSTTNLCLELSQREISALLAVVTEQMTWKTRWFNDPDDEYISFANKLAYKLLSASYCQENSISGEVTWISAGGIDNNTECEGDDMGCKLDIEYRSGLPYLRMDCGCGEARYFSLIQSAFDSLGNPIPASDMYQGDFPLQTSPDNVPCYGGKAANYLIDRAIAFWHTVIDLIVVGIDAVSPADEVMDVASIVLQLSSGDTLRDLVGDASKSQVTTAFNAIKTAMSNSWTAASSVNRAELLKWTKTAPYFQDNLPVREMLFTWASTSFVLGYNEQLAIYAAECETGSELVPQTPAIPLGSTLSAIENSGNWEVLLSGDFATLTNPMSGKIVGVGMVAERTGGTNYLTIAAFTEFE